MTHGVKRWGIPALFASVLWFSNPGPAAAQAGCVPDLRTCYIQASRMRYWTDMWLAGLDCELNFLECSRRTLMGR